MALEYDSNPVLHVDLSGVGSTRSAPGVALKVGPAFWPLCIAKQKLVYIKSDSRSIRFSQPAQASSNLP